MKHKLSYYFSNEFYQKNKQEKLNTIKELITNYDNVYNSYESISFTVKQFDEKIKKITANVKTFIILFIIASFIIFTYILLKSFEIKINIFYFLLISLIIAFLFIFYIIKEIKKEKKTQIKSIELNQNILKLIFEDNQEKEYNIKNINLTSKIINNRDNSHSNDYLITIQEKNKLTKEKYHLNATQVENEFFATIIFIKCLILSIEIKDITNNQLETLYSNVFNNNIGLEAKNKNYSQTCLILGLFCSFVSLIAFINIIFNVYEIIKFDKVEATITDLKKIRHYDNEGNTTKYYQIELKYEYNEETYFENITHNYNIFNLFLKKKTIYVDKSNPQNFTYFRLDNIILFIPLTFLSYFLLKKYKNLNQLN